MPTTSGDSLPYFQLSDPPDGGSQSQAMMNAVQSGLNKRGTVRGRQLTRSTTASISNGFNAVSTFPDGTTYNVGGITYGSGIYTATVPGLWMWFATVLFPADSSAQRAGLTIAVNGGEPTYKQGYNDLMLNATHALNLSACGAIPLNVNDTLQLRIYYTGTSLAGVQPACFTVVPLAP